MTVEEKPITEEEVASLFEHAYMGTPVVPEVEDDKEDAPLVEEEVEESPPAEEESAETEEPVEEEPVQENPIDTLLSSLPEEQAASVKKLLEERARIEHQYRSSEGRLAAERRQRWQMEQELNKLRSRVSGKAPQDKHIAGQTKADYEKSISEWKEVVEAEPTLAKAVDALTDAKVGEAVEAMRAELMERDTVQQRLAVESERQRELEMLVEAVPNAMEVIQSQEFQYWKNHVAPPGLRQLADTSIRHEDAISVMQYYAPWAQQLAEQRSQPTGQTPATPNATTTVADQISKARQNKNSPVVRGAPARPKVTATMGQEFSHEEGERLFAEAFKKITGK